MKIKACLTSNNQFWRTPKKIYDYYMKNGYFDPCPVNPQFDGLNIEWYQKNFVNPPYNQIKKWVDKAIEEDKKGHKSVLLIPARTDTKWFKKLYDYGCLFGFIEGRLKFSEGGAAPFPSMFVFFDNNTRSCMTYYTKLDMEVLFN